MSGLTLAAETGVISLSGGNLTLIIAVGGTPWSRSRWRWSSPPRCSPPEKAPRT